MAINSGEVARGVSLYLGVASTHPAVISIASRINVANLHVPPGSDLSRNPEFHRLILTAGGRELLDIVDPSRRDQIAQLQAQVTGAHAFRYDPHLGAYGLGHAWSDRASDAGGSGGEGSSRSDYGELGGDMGGITPLELRPLALSSLRHGLWNLLFPAFARLQRPEHHQCRERRAGLGLQSA